MTDSCKETQKEIYKEWSKTKEAEQLRSLENITNMRLDGIAFFLANNPPLSSLETDD